MTFKYFSAQRFTLQWDEYYNIGRHVVFSASYFEEVTKC